jgi:hypothetical protein
MPAGNIQISIDKYELKHFACGRRDPLNVIDCYSLNPASGKLSSVGQISFYGDRVPLSTYDIYAPTVVHKFYLNYGIDRYHDVIETLRYEKPIFVSFSLGIEGNIISAYISTSKEPIGEQEGQGMPA